MDSPITRAEHEEFRRRMEEEHSRTNQRLTNLEEITKQITDIAVSTKELAISVKQMAETQKEQSIKLEELSSRDGKMWRSIVSYAVTTIVSIIIGFAASQIGL